jgi:hypothetical protein
MVVGTYCQCQLRMLVYLLPQPCKLRNVHKWVECKVKRQQVTACILEAVLRDKIEKTEGLSLDIYVSFRLELVLLILDL